MQRERKLYLTICDYNKNAVCDIYDNQSDISGQAANVFIDRERNGWKELSFDIPSTCSGENGEEPNYRLDYLIAEYKIRAVEEDETDWFIISEPKITRNGFSKNVSVRAPHISITLKNKNMDLEFSDEEGNNVGTAEQLLTTILEGTGWTPGFIDDFLEDNSSVKKRSLSGQAGTGSLSFIEQLCDLFEAKPVYHGDSMTVDLLKMNPFAKIDTEDIPKQLVDSGDVIELYYDRNVHDLSKTTNTENMVTRLYAYGSSGDKNGACTLQNAEHTEYTFVVNTTGEEYCFEDFGGTKRFFADNLSAGDSVVWSDMDLSSKSYVWNNTKRIAYRVYNKPTGTYVTLTNPQMDVVKNKFPFLLGLNYYDDVGLMSEEQFQEIALFQRTLPEIYQTSEDAAADFAQDETDLSKIAESNTGFLKFKVTRDYSVDTDGAIRIYIDDVLYRTDYDEAERRYFQWHITKQLRANGDPVSGTPSLVFIVHNTDPVTWDRVYLKRIYDQAGNLIVDSEGNPGDFRYDMDVRPGSIAVWSDDIRFDSGDRFYLFCTNSMSGLLGARQAEDEAVIENLQNTTMDGSEFHPTYFVKQGETKPTAQSITSSYAWCYEFQEELANVGKLYFYWRAKNDDGWKYVYVQHEAPSIANNGEYFFSLRYKKLYKWRGQWVEYTSAAEQRVANSFSKVFYYCRRRDMLNKGLYEYYYHDTPHLDVANYAIPNDFAFYWTFTTTQDVYSRLKLDTVKGQVYQDSDVNHIVPSSVVPLDTVFYPAENELNNVSFAEGTIDSSTGVEEDSDSKYRSTSLRVWENTIYEYSLPANSFAVFYTISLKFISSVALTGSTASTGQFTTPANTRYVRFVSGSIPTTYVRVLGYDTRFYINDKPYIILNPITHDGELIGLISLTKKFADLSDKTYGTDLVTMQRTQEEIRTANNNLSVSLGEMIKDGRWQDANYISGDEKRLYDETFDMLRQVSRPEITYSFTYLSMYGVQNEHYYEKHESTWPIVTITDTAHLVDTESKTNCWAYIDKIHDCYDAPWKTTIEVDTKLTLAARHGFTDVIARIAEVAKELKAKQPQYDRAVSGSIASARLEGAISLFTSYIQGGSSNWYTDEKGNMIFESADGLSAMMLGGRGLCIANSRNSDGSWNFRTAATGMGMSADEIYTGYLSADRIEASSITTDKLMANVGQELDIGSNKALMLFATVNGSRPAGTVKTTDGYIEIIAGYQSGGVTVPAKINVISGGELNLTGGKVNITSNGKLDVTSSGEFTLKAHGANNLDSTADGIYMGSDGVNFGGGKFKVSFNGNTSTVYMNSSLIQIGSTSADTLKKKLDDMTSATETAQSTADSKAQTYRCTAAQITTKHYQVGDIWVDTGSSYQWEYICKQVSNPRNSSSDWMLVSTAITQGAALSVDATNGVINMVAANTITIASGATINIAAGKALNLTTKGTVTIGNGGRPFTIGSNGTDAYIYNGTSSFDSTSKGIYLGTDGISLGGGVFKVTRDGAVSGSNMTITGGSITLKSSDGTTTYFSANSSGASISGTIKASSLYIGNKQTNFSIDDSGKLNIDSLNDGLKTTITSTAEGLSSEITRATAAEGSLSTRITQTSEAISSEVTRATTAEGSLSTRITQNADSISSEVTRATTAEGNLSSRITQTAESISSEVTRATNAETSLGTRITQTSEAITAEVTRAKNAESTLSSTITQTAESVTTTVKQYADGVAGTAESNAKSYAASVATTAETNAKNASIAKTDTYQSAAAIVTTAETYAAGVAGTAESNAKSYADGVAGAAESSAKSYADSVAAAAAESAKGASIARTLQYQDANSIVLAAETYTDDNAYAKVSGIAITASGIDITGSKYVNITSGENYVKLNSGGIDIKGSKVTITESSGEKCDLWGRNDIVVMNPNETDPNKIWRKTVAEIESHMSGKHDWVLVRPYYDAQILYNITGINKNVSEHSNLALGKNSEEAFGDAASGYSYDLTVVVKRTNANAQPSLYFRIYATKGSDRRTILLGSGNFSASGGAEAYTGQSEYYNIQMIRTASGIEKEADYGGIIGNWIFRTTLTAGAGAGHNLAGDGYSIFMDVGGTIYGSGYAYVQSVEIVAHSNASTSRVPCTVYYYP